MSASSELRRDPAGGNWVIIAPDRANRPDEFRPRAVRPAGGSAASCPFCPGREARTPPEVAAVRPPSSPPDGPGWRVRVVPNKFPALSRAGGHPEMRTGGLFQGLDGVGVHEVVIETPDHAADFSSLSPGAAGEVVRTWRDRLRALAAEPSCAYVQLFKNYGRAAGASLSHLHSQVVALPVVPGRIREEIGLAARFHAANGACLHCRVIAEETALAKRVILRDADFIATAPYASRFPYEIHIHPLRHAARFTSAEDGETGALAALLRVVLGRLRRALDDPPFNLLLHQSPPVRKAGLSAGDESPAYHWHIEILPVLTRVAGFEWGTDIHINPIPPEAAAERLAGI
ncbi:MAG: DUF4921 family protein [Candidatus Aminicenantales bacterium]|jgi:UDPglucose--hexose-1-phosphate uridylyltransferase